jgi:hypothetical protein
MLVLSMNLNAQHETKTVSQGMKFLYKGMKKVFKVWKKN